MKIEYKIMIKIDDKLWLCRYITDDELKAINLAEVWAGEYSIQIEKVTEETVYVVHKNQKGRVVKELKA